MKIDGVILDWMGTLNERNVGLFSFTKDVLDYLKPKYKLGLISVAGEGIKKRTKEINESGIKHYFDSIIITSKKTPEEYLKCCKELNIKPERSAVVDDIAIVGVKIGNEVGATTFWVHEGDRSHLIPTDETEKPNFKIKSINELKNFL